MYLSSVRIAVRALSKHSSTLNIHSEVLMKTSIIEINKLLHRIAVLCVNNEDVLVNFNSTDFNQYCMFNVLLRFVCTPTALCNEDSYKGFVHI